MEREYPANKKKKMLQQIWVEILEIYKNVLKIIEDKFKEISNEYYNTKFDINHNQLAIASIHQSFAQCSIIEGCKAKKQACIASLNKINVVQPKKNNESICIGCGYGFGSEYIISCTNHHSLCLNCAVKFMLQQNLGYYNGDQRNWIGRCGIKFCKGFWMDTKKIEIFIESQYQDSLKYPLKYPEIYNCSPNWNCPKFIRNQEICAFCYSTTSYKIIKHEQPPYEKETDIFEERCQFISHAICYNCLLDYWEELNGKSPFLFESFDGNFEPRSLGNACPFPFCKHKFSLDKIYDFYESKISKKEEFGQLILAYIKHSPGKVMNDFEIVL